MPLKPENMTGEVRNIVEAVEGYYSPHLFGVVVCALDISETEEEFLRRLDHSLEKLTEEINLIQTQIEEVKQLEK